METLQVKRVERRPQPQVDNEVDSAPSAQVRIIYMIGILISLQGVSKKRYFSDFLSYFSSKGRILLFHMCFGIRISSPFHLAIQKVSIQNLNCPKNACADMIFIPALRSED